MALLQYLNFHSIYGNLVGLFRGVITPGDSVLGSSAGFDASTGIGFHGCIFSALSGVAAGTSTGQANATPLVAFINRVTTVATNDGGVALPPSQPGMCITVINDAASNTLTVFGNNAEGATIDGVATGTGNTLAAGHRGEYVCSIQGAWQSFGGAKAS